MRSVNTIGTISIAIVLFVIVFVASSASAASWQMETLTDNGVSDLYPSIYGSQIVWMRHDYNDWEIYLHDGTSEMALTDNTVSDEGPDIWGDNIAWGVNGFGWVDNEIYRNTVTGPELVTVGDAVGRGPSVSGERIVWNGYDGSKYQVFQFDGSDITQLSNSSDNFNHVSPDVSGENVVWNTGALGPGAFVNEIYLHDGVSATKIGEGLSAAISGDNVVWRAKGGEGEFTDDYEVWHYDIGTEVTTQITNNDVDEWSPVVSGEYIAWHVSDGNDDEIYFYDGGDIWQLTDNEIDDRGVDIFGLDIVWHAEEGGGDFEIMLATQFPGDYNLDGIVDQADYTVWADSYGDAGIGLFADGNGDYVIDQADYTVWADNYGNRLFGESSTSVPEPTTLALITFGTFGLLRRLGRGD